MSLSELSGGHMAGHTGPGHGFWARRGGFWSEAGEQDRWRRRMYVAAHLVVSASVVALTATGFTVSCVGSTSRSVSMSRSPLNEPPSTAAVAAEIDVEGFGTWSGLRLGDLDGDGTLDFLLAQNRGQAITCLTALNLSGRRLWQVGNPGIENYHTSYDLPIQLFDIDQDGADEVICIVDRQVMILDGRSGRMQRTSPLPSVGATDSLSILNVDGGPWPGAILVKNRYSQVWVLGRDLGAVWTHAGRVGHFPWPVDLDHDGRDELMCGYTLLDDDGTELWHADLPGHADAVAVGDVDGRAANGSEIAIACCNGGRFVLINRVGKVLWSRECELAQHIVVGNFRADLGGLEVCGVDRGPDRSDQGIDALMLYSSTGELLWRETRSDQGNNRWLTIVSTVDSWDEGPEARILAYRRGGSMPPRLYNGFGRAMAVLPWPSPERQHFAQHVDVMGDGREEIIAWDERQIAVFKNSRSLSAPLRRRPAWPDPRLYNYSHYIGMS